MPPHMAPLLGIATGMPNSHKAKVGEQIYRTLPSMNLCPSSSSGSLEYWTGFLKLDRAAFVDTVSAAFDGLHSHYSPGLPAWSLPPHSLAQNLFAFLFTIFYRPDRLIEGFGAGAYSAAVAAALSLAPPKPFPLGSPDSLLISLGGLAMHPPTFTHLIRAFGAVHNAEITVLEDFLKPRPDKESRPSTYVSKWNKDNRPEFKTAMLLVQHVHDCVSPWTLSPLLLSYLYNLGIKVLTLHDDLEAQKDYALLHQKPLVPFSHFGSDRHDYERVVPTLKTFSASTFFSNFLEPLTYEQLEAREGSLGSTYCPDLLDLVIGLFTYLGTVPPLLFGAQPDALTQTLIHGCHRPPAVTTSPLFPSTMELHKSPVHFYTKIFLHSQTPLPSLSGLPADDILALEESLKQPLLSLPLPQALDVLHTQVLSCMCVSSPLREAPNTGAPPIACYLSPVEGGSTTSIAPPVFRCWIGRKVSPNMAILDFKCDSLPWASSYIKGTVIVRIGSEAAVPVEQNPMAPRSCMACVLTYQQVQDISAGREVHQLGAFAKVKCECKSKSNIIVNAPLNARSLHKVEASSFGVQAICPIAPSLGLALLGT